MEIQKYGTYTIWISGNMEFLKTVYENSYSNRL